MPTRTPVLAAWTPALVAEVVAAALEHATVDGLHRAFRDVARSCGLSPATVEEWVARARAVQAAPVPPDLLACHTCARSTILIQLPGCGWAYLCAPSCGRTPVPADEIRDAVAAVILHRTPHLVPPGSRPRPPPARSARSTASPSARPAQTCTSPGELSPGRSPSDDGHGPAPAPGPTPRPITDHRRAHPHHPAIARMTAALYRMHTTATDPLGHPTRFAMTATPGAS